MYFFFFYPVGTRPQPDRPAPGSLLLLVALAAVFSVRYFRPDIYADLIWASYRPSVPALSGAVLSIFLHGSWPHLLGNGLYLVIFGRQLEGRIGFPMVASIFVLGGVAGCYAQGWFTPVDSWGYNTPVVGASGAIAALLGATILRFHHTRIRILYFVFALLGGMTKGGVVYVNTVVATLGWFAFQLIYSLVAWGNGGASTAYMAHAGGFAVGMLLGLALRLPAQARMEIHLERGRRHFEAGNWFAAAGELADHLAVAGESDEARTMRGRCYVLLGRSAEAAEEYQIAFRRAHRIGDRAAEATLYREMRRYGIAPGLQEPALLRLAFDLQKAGEYAAAADAYWEIETTSAGGSRAELAAIRRAEILWDQIGDIEGAKAAYRRLLTDYPDGDWAELARARLQSMQVLTGAEEPDESTPDDAAVSGLRDRPTAPSRGTPAHARSSSSLPRRTSSPR